jgi:DNA invertase Pin-like site-specific DNA recombinase
MSADYQENLETTKKKVIEQMIAAPESYAAIYTRKSNLSDSMSLNNQMSDGYKKALENNLKVYKVYEESISATKYSYLERKQVNELLEDIKSGFFKTVIVYKRDRLARNSAEFFEIKSILKKYGVRIIYSCSDEYQPSYTATGDFIENIIAAVAELEPNVIAQRTKDGKQKKRDSGIYSKGGHLPFGFKENIHPNNSIEFIPDENKDFIQKLFTLYIEKPVDERLDREIESSSELYDKLNETWGSLPGKFTLSKIGEIIPNPTYAGLLYREESNNRMLEAFTIEDGEVIKIDENKFQKLINLEPIIEKKVWFEAVKKWFSNHIPHENHQKKSSHLLKGLVYCKKCDTRLTISNNKLLCKTKGCIKFNLNKITRIILKNIINDIFANPNNSEYAVLKKKKNDANNGLNKTEKELAALISKQEKLIDEYLSGKTDNEKDINENVLDLEKIEEKLKSYRISKEYFTALTDKLAFLKGDNIAIEEIIAAMIRNSETTARYLNNYIKRIDIDEHSNITIHPY